jgi:glycosyltransferase involved in cell wall biosynthesis
VRIVLVTSAYPPFVRFGGQPGHAAGLARELSRRGHRVEVLTANHDLGRPGFLRIDGGVRAHYLRAIARYRSAGTVNPAAVTTASRLVGRSDVIHLFGMYDLLGPAAALAAHRARVPYLVEPMGMFRPIVRSLHKKRLYHRLIGGRLVAGAAGVVATSQLERDDLLRSGIRGRRIFVRPNGIDLDAFDDLPGRGLLRARYGIAPDAPLILFLGRLTPVKRPGLVIDALVMQADLSAWALFVGPDEDGMRGALERRAAERGVSERVVFTGPMYEQDKLKALVDADVLALPSMSENFGNVVLEALACGLPVVLSDRCGIAPEISGRAGYVIRPEAAPLAEALARVLGDPAMRGRVAKVGPAIARRYSWEKVAVNMQDIYETVVADSRL